MVSCQAKTFLVAGATTIGANSTGGEGVADAERIVHVPVQAHYETTFACSYSHFCHVAGRGSVRARSGSPEVSFDGRASSGRRRLCPRLPRHDDRSEER